MVVPPAAASLVRSLVGSSRTRTPTGTPGVSSAGSSRGGGNGTIVVEIDGRALTSVTDQRLAVAEDLVHVRTGGASWR
jgi:hypothetical protein